MGQWITEEEEYDIRYSQQADLDLLKEWLSFEEAMRWYPVSSPKNAEVMASNWIGFSRFKASLTAVYKEKAVGIATLFLMPYRKLIHHAMLYLIVAPTEWRKGVGTSLLRNIAHLGKNGFRLEQLHGEVYEGCPIVSLLKKGGYQEIARQEKAVKEGEGRYLARSIFEVNLTLEQVEVAKDG